MNFEHDEIERMLAESAGRYALDNGGIEAARAAAGLPGGFAPDSWREMAEMGWAGIAIPEEFGGLGYGYTGLGLVLEQVGRNLSSSPLESTDRLTLADARRMEEPVPVIDFGASAIRFYRLTSRLACRQHSTILLRNTKTLSRESNKGQDTPKKNGFGFPGRS